MENKDSFIDNEEQTQPKKNSCNKALDEINKSLDAIEKELNEMENYERK